MPLAAQPGGSDRGRQASDRGRRQDTARQWADRGPGAPAGRTGQAEQIGLAQINVAQQPREQISGNSCGDGASWQVTADEMIVDVVAEYTEACTESRRIAARFALDDTVPHHRLG
nr:DUF664 domain-containing protein [Micromonospora sp. A202]